MKIIYNSELKGKQQVKNRKKRKDAELTWKERSLLVLKNTGLIISIIFLLLFAGDLFRFTWYSGYFNLNKVEIPTLLHINKEQVIRENGLNQPINIIKISENKISRNLSANPWVASVQVKRKFPNTILLDIKEREPIALVVGKTTWGIDEQGILLPGLLPEVAAQIPLISMGDNWAPPANLKVNTPEMKRALELIVRIKKEHADLLPQISEFNITQTDNLVFYTQPDGTEVRMGMENQEERLDRFCKTWTMSQEQNLIQEYIDLRYEEQGVITKPRMVRKPKKQDAPTPST